MHFSLAVATTGPVGALSPRFARVGGAGVFGATAGHWWPHTAPRSKQDGNHPATAPPPPPNPATTNPNTKRHPHHALTHLLQLCSRTRRSPPGRRHLERRRSQQARTPPLPRPRPSQPERPVAHRIRLRPISRGPPQPLLPAHLTAAHQATRLRRAHAQRTPTRSLLQPAPQLRIANQSPNNGFSEVNE